MNWFRNLRVAYKIVCLIIVSVLAMVSVGLTGISYLRSTQSAMEQMANKQVQAVQLLGDCSIIVRSMQARILENVSLTDHAQIVKNKKNIQEYMDQYEDAWQKYKALGINGEQESTIEEQWSAFKGHTNQMLDLSVNGDQQGAKNLYNTQAIKEIIGWDDAMQPLRQDLTQQAKDLNEQNSGAVSSAVVNMSVQVLVTLLILCLLGWMLINTIQEPLRSMMAICERLGEGDFRETAARKDRRDEFGEMEKRVDTMRQNLSKLMGHTNESASQIAAASEELTASSQQSAQASQQVADSVQKASEAVTEQENGVATSSHSIEQVSQSVSHLQDEAGRVAEHATAAFNQAVSGSGAVQNSVNQIRSVEKTVGESASIVDKLGERSQEIGQIVETISGIADQTNLLALNAAIEAARAGEQGRGFSVVADEVRKLAEASQESAQQISVLIKNIQDDTGNAVASMKQGSSAVAEGAQSVEELRKTFEQIKDYIDDVSKEVAQMAQAISEVADHTGAISSNIEDINTQGNKVAEEMESVSAATEEQSASASEIASASDSLARLAQELQQNLQKFRF